MTGFVLKNQDEYTECVLREAWQDGVSGESGLENGAFFLTILASQRQGKTCLPNMLGLSEEHQESLKKSMDAEPVLNDWKQLEDKDDLRQQLLMMRLDEWNDLRELLIKHRNQSSISELWMAEIVAAGCLGGDHLWRDLGLPSRKALRSLLENNFLSLTNLNTKDMKWKRFFYKQLCEQEGSYVCRAPTCEECAVYDDCFGLEE